PSLRQVKVVASTILIVDHTRKGRPKIPTVDYDTVYLLQRVNYSYTTRKQKPDYPSLVDKGVLSDPNKLSEFRQFVPPHFP
ncbi:Hypothetical predicted protein, partial [Marmota monax]